MEHKSQTEAVLAHLEKHGCITSLEAIEKYGATRLSAIIFNLKKKGYLIKSEPFKVSTRYGRVSRPSRYILQQKN